jgi:uncharacterized protein YciI
METDINSITNEFIMQSVSKGKKYTLVLLKAGKNRNQNPEETDKIQMEHLRYLFKLRAEKKLLLNGPLLNNDVIVGIGIYDSTDIEEVKRLTEGDPAFKAGRLDYEVYEWFGLPGDLLV